MIAGPSEIVVLADETAKPNEIAADLLSQAEHDERAVSIFVTPSLQLALKVEEEVEKQLATLPRKTSHKSNSRLRCHLCDRYDEASDRCRKRISARTFRNYDGRAV